MRPWSGDGLLELEDENNTINNHRRPTVAARKAKTKISGHIQISQVLVLQTRLLTTESYPWEYKYQGIPHVLPGFYYRSSSAIIQISAAFSTIHTTFFERFLASNHHPKCLPPPSTPRPPTPPWEPTATPTASSCKATPFGSVFALQTGCANSNSERRHNYF